MKVYFSLFFFIISINIFSQQQFSVFFESNKFDLKKAEAEKLQKWIETNKKIKIIGVSGFCDEDGTASFNDSLAKKRIDFVFNLIKNKLAIREDFKSRNFGETHQLSKVKAANRKVTLFFIEAKDLARENEILKIKEPEEIQKVVSNIQYPEKIVLDNPNGTKSEFKLDVAFMQAVNQAKAGEKLKMNNLNFQINTFAVMPESRGKLFELLIVMENNPKLEIDIQGHLCCMAKDRTDLSTQRAKAIYNFLIVNKIDKSRLSYKGFGSTEPIFSIPEKSEAERAANRRVELVIVAN